MFVTVTYTSTWQGQMPCVPIMEFHSTIEKERKEEEQSKAQKITKLIKREKEEGKRKGQGKNSREVDIMKQHGKWVNFHHWRANSARVR